MSTASSERYAASFVKALLILASRTAVLGAAREQVSARLSAHAFDEETLVCMRSGVVSEHGHTCHFDGCIVMFCNRHTKPHLNVHTHMCMLKLTSVSEFRPYFYVQSAAQRLDALHVQTAIDS